MRLSKKLPILVDVSTELDRPREISSSSLLSTTLSAYLDSLVEILSSPTSSTTLLFNAPSVTPESFTPSILALLCGYPVAYYTSNENGGTCLDGLSLTVVQVSFRLQCEEWRTGYSFSFPADVDGGDEIEARVDEWERELRGECVKDGTVEVKVEKTTAVRDRVVM